MANRNVINLDTLKDRFPTAYADLVSGNWQDNNTGEDVTSRPQLEAWLNDINAEFYVDAVGRLHWLDTLEGDQVWDGRYWEYCGPHPSWPE